MIRFTAFASIACCSLCAAVNPEYTVTHSGTWPSSWPKELEPLRNLSRTYEGPLAPNQHYAIPFTKREDFESA